MLYTILTHEFFKTGAGAFIGDVISKLSSFYIIGGICFWYVLLAIVMVENYIEYREFESVVDTSQPIYYSVSPHPECEYIFDSNYKVYDAVIKDASTCTLSQESMIEYIERHKENSRGINQVDSLEYWIWVIVPFLFICMGALLSDGGFKSFVVASIVWMMFSFMSFFLVYRDYNCITSEYYTGADGYSKKVYVTRGFIRKNVEGEYEGLCFCATLMGNLSGNPPSVNDWR